MRYISKEIIAALVNTPMTHAQYAQLRWNVACELIVASDIVRTLHAANVPDTHCNPSMQMFNDANTVWSALQTITPV